jgi:dihydrofolate reductase
LRKIIVVNHVTLDGVMQGPGRPDEDRRGGFEHGGWAFANFDPVMNAAMAEGMARGGDLLFGRRTYEDFAGFWPHQKDNPFTQVLDQAQKYVASTQLRKPLPWINSTLLEGDVAQAVGRLKNEEGNDLVILGSGELIKSLMPHGLIDEYLLMIHPLLFGKGRRLFTDGGPSITLQLLDAKATTKGVIIATYKSAMSREGPG